MRSFSWFKWSLDSSRCFLHHSLNSTRQCSKMKFTLNIHENVEDFKWKKLFICVLFFIYFQVQTIILFSDTQENHYRQTERHFFHLKWPYINNLKKIPSTDELSNKRGNGCMSSTVSLSVPVLKLSNIHQVVFIQVKIF